MKKFLRAVTFVAMVCLIATGYTDINDPTTLKEEQFVVNKMWLSGFSISGLDESFDGKTAELKMVTKVETVVDGKVDEGQTSNTEKTIASATVGDTVKSYISGCAYVKLDKPVLIERDKDKTEVVDKKTTKNTSTSYYVKITTDSGVVVVKALGDDNALENAVLEVVPSPYGTKDDELEARFVTVQASNAKDSAEIIGTFAWAENVKEPLDKLEEYPTVIASAWGNYALDFKDGDEASVTITEDKDTNWDGAEFGVVYGTTDKVDWGTKYTGATSSAKDTYYPCTKGAGDNNKIDGDVSLPITITVKIVGRNVSVKYN